MRPQLGPIPDGSPNGGSANLEDLGWNDMGDDAEGKIGATILQLDLPKAANEEVEAAKLLKAKSGNKPAKSTKAQGKRAAFTLRLDPERHLKLRLASTMMDRSAQQIVTEALDALLSEIDELESLAAKMQRS